MAENSPDDVNALLLDSYAELKLNKDKLTEIVSSEAPVANKLENI